MISSSSPIQSIAYCLFLASFSIPVIPVTQALSLRGSPAVTLQLKGTKSSHSHPIASHGGPITLWCAPEGQQGKIVSANFTRESDGKRHAAVVSENKRNATWTITHPTILDAGSWICRLATQFEAGTYKTHIYARPVAHAEDSESFSLIDGKDAQLQDLPTEVAAGQSKNITCPALGHPTPTISWSKDGQPLGDRLGNTITINNASAQNVGVYVCQAGNEFKSMGIAHRYLLVVKKELKLKSELAWLVPLGLIFVLFALLIIVILLCEIHRKRVEKKRAESEVAILED